MRKFHSMIAALSLALLLGGVGQAAAQFYTQHNLVSDVPGMADLTDPALINAWGLAASATSPWWISNNGSGTSTLYNGNTGAKIPLTNLPCQCVIVPGAPTGTVFYGGAGFVVTDPVSGASGPARFLFASEDGSISGWNPGVPPPVPPPPLVSSQAIIAVQPSDANVYKGLAIASTNPGDVTGDFLYATNFHAGTVDVFDHTFAPVHMPGAFSDPKLPKGYAPFGIRNINGTIYVTYALQDADKHDDVRGMGHGFVNAFDTAGTLLGRVASRGTLNSPWGLALASDDFGEFSGNLLIGNFGDGRIHAYGLPGTRGRGNSEVDEDDHGHDDGRGNGEFRFRGLLHSAGGPPLEIDGLWGLSFGNGGTAGPTNELFFTAGPQDESNGLFGSILPVARKGHR